MKTKVSSTCHTYPIIRSVTVAVTCLWCTALSLNAAAQSSGQLEEVVVTAQKREQSLNDVPISMLAFSRDDLTTFKLENSNDLMNVTPGLYMNGPYAHSNPKIVMRGLGTDDFTEVVNPTVGYYVAEVFIGAPVGMTIGLLDLERIEVLKGPQGTLYGRNTTAGAINFISRKPGDTFSANGKAGFGNFDAYEIEAAADIPLSENLKSRIAVKSYSRDGTTKNRKWEDTLNNEVYQQGRAQLLWTPTENLSALFILEAYFNQSDGLVSQQSGFQPAGATADVLGYRDTDGDNYAGEYTRRGGDDTDAYSATIKLDASGDATGTVDVTADETTIGNELELKGDLVFSDEAADEFSIAEDGTSNDYVIKNLSNDKDIIIKGSINIVPMEIEEVVHEHPSVLECVVVGKEDKIHGEDIAVVVVKNGYADEKKLSQEIKNLCRDRFSSYKVPSYVEFWENIPKTPSKKLMRRKVKELINRN